MRTPNSHRPTKSRSSRPYPRAKGLRASYRHSARRKVAAMLVGMAPLLVAAPSQAEPTTLPPAFAYHYGVNETPRSASMSGALHALGTSTTATFLNPANLGLARVYHLQASAQVSPESGRQLYGATIVDSSRRLSGAISFIGGLMDPDGMDRRMLDGRVALAYGVTPDVHLGLSGRYLNLIQEGLGPLGNSRASGGLLGEDGTRQPLISAFTFDAGFTARIAKRFFLSAFGHNLSYPDNGFLPTTAGGALAYGSPQLSVEADAVVDFTSYSETSVRAMAGGEFLVAGRVPLALGYRFDLLDPAISEASHQLSAGAGYVDKRFSVRVGVRRTIVGPSQTTVVAGLAYHLESSGAINIQPY